MFLGQFDQFEKKLIVVSSIVLMITGLLLSDDRWLYKLSDPNKYDLNHVGIIESSQKDV